MARVGDRQGKIEGHFLTGQSPQWAVAPTEEEEEGERRRSVTQQGIGCKLPDDDVKMSKHVAVQITQRDCCDIQGISGGTVNILIGGSMDYSE